MVEIIQQWQFLGRVHPDLLKDEVLERCKKCGIISLQSYVPWSEIEKEQGRFDFSAYDELVSKIKKHNLKWVPFIIFGPDYATPKWFHESGDSVYAKCLEHQKESRIQSIWNPNLKKYIEIFLSKVAEKYKDSGILESIALGISGNWGEAIYPVTGGFYGGSHTHLGFWCADRYAKQAKIEFPFLEKKNSLSSFLIFLSGSLPDWFKRILKVFLRAFKKGAFLMPEQSYSPKEKGKKWLEFINWYIGSMNDWVDLWLRTARNVFPDQKIYLVTGGTGHPAAGADFVKQVKIAAKYGAGIRITNQTNDYGQSFILTRLVSSACKLYNSYFITEEEAVLQSPEGVVMRIFDAVSSGARGIYCKNFISIGGDPVIKKFMLVGEVTAGAEALLNNIRYFKGENPMVKAAVLFPNNLIYSDPRLIISLYNKCAFLREFLDFDLIDENMILDGGLNNYQYVLVLSGEIAEGKIMGKIKEWKEKGGKLILNPEIEKLDFLTDKEKDGVYSTLFDNKILLYNSTNSRKRKNIKNMAVDINPNSILEIKI